MEVRMIHIEISTYCGANCIMCPHHVYDYKGRIMDFDLLKKIVDNCADVGIKHIVYSGIGDAFLDPGLIEKLKYTKSSYPYMSIVMSTTGHIIDFDALKYVDILKFSNYGISKKVFEAVHRGSVDYDKALSNIKKVLEMPDGVRPYTHMQFLVLEENATEVEQWKAYWEHQSVDEIWIWKPVTWSGYYDTPGWGVINYSESIPCNRVFNPALQVKVNGKVSICCYDVGNELIIGDLTQNSLDEIIFGGGGNSIIKKLQIVHKNRSFENCEFEACKKCDQILNREHALIYSSQNRKTGATALRSGEEIRYSGLN